MYVDVNNDKLYFQQGNFYQRIRIEYQCLDINKMKFKDSIKIEKYEVVNHITTIQLGEMLVQGMRNLVSFICLKNKVCIGEFMCDGRVDRIRVSNDNKEIFIYTDKCKLYRL